MINKIFLPLLVIVLLLTGCSNDVISDENSADTSSADTVSYDSDEEKQEMMKLNYNGNYNYKVGCFFADDTRKIKGKNLYVLLQHEISFKNFNYTAADFGITDNEKIAEIKDLGLSEWQQNLYGWDTGFIIRREIQITLNKADEEYLLELAKKVYEQSFVYSVSVDYKEGSYTNYSNGDNIEKAVIKKELPLFENKEQLKQYMIKRKYPDERLLKCDYSNYIYGTTLSIILPRELSYCEFEYIAADFGITDTSKIKEIKSHIFGKITNIYYYQEIKIILKEPDVDYLIELAKRVYEKPFVTKVYIDSYEEFSVGE